MTVQPFRFIHAADLHIERPINGLSDCPVHLEDRILDAPRAAAARLFRYAVEEKVDFIVLSGDIINPQSTGPWGLLFLIDEFKKLEKEKIPVYWAGGKCDPPDEIPSAFQFPSNVHIFPIGQAEEFLYIKNETPTARIIGTSAGRQAVSFRPPEPPQDEEGLFTICAFYGKVNPETVRGDGVQYWALGGQHRREFLMRSPIVIHNPGPTLARNPLDIGDFGFSLVEVDEFGRAKVDLVKTSPIIWTTERLVIRDDMTEEQILAEMRARIKKLREVQNDDNMLFISWRAEAGTALIQELRYGNIVQSILREIRADFSREVPVVHSVDMKPILPDLFSSDLYDQQTILGDYLRMLHYYQENPTEKIDTTLFFSDELRDYLDTKIEMERLRLAQAGQKEGVTGPVPESILSASMDIRSFRPEAEFLTNLLLLESDPNKDEDPEVGPTPERTDRELHKKRMEQRTAVLREAAMTGIELLSVADEPVTPTLKSAVGPRKNPILAQEYRQFLQQSSEKEDRS